MINKAEQLALYFSIAIAVRLQHHDGREPHWMCECRSQWIRVGQSDESALATVDNDFLDLPVDLVLPARTVHNSSSESETEGAQQAPDGTLPKRAPNQFTTTKD